MAVDVRLKSSISGFHSTDNSLSRSFSSFSRQTRFAQDKAPTGDELTQQTLTIARRIGRKVNAR